MNLLKVIRYIFFAAVISLVSIECGSSTDPLPVLSDKFSDIQSRTLDRSCAYTDCHIGDYSDSDFPKAFLSLQRDSSYNQLLFNHKIQDDQVAKEFKALVVPFEPDSSYLIFKLRLPGQSNLYGDPMPSRQSSLPSNEIDAIISWIRRGAPND